MTEMAWQIQIDPSHDTHDIICSVLPTAEVNRQTEQQRQVRHYRNTKVWQGIIITVEEHVWPCFTAIGLQFTSLFGGVIRFFVQAVKVTDAADNAQPLLSVNNKRTV